jgi:hypothetical protein
MNPHSRTIYISAPGLSLLVSFALRYCYRRETAAAHAAIGQVLPIFDQLPTLDQAQIRREIQRELERNGLECVEDWERFLLKTAPKEEEVTA